MHTDITLMRHGETDWNADGRWQGVAPTPLNANGVQQAKTAAPFLRSAGISQLISSDLLRCRTTAQIVADVLGLPIILDKRWREIDLGRWQGLNRAEIEAWDGDAYRRFHEVSYLDRLFPDGERQQEHIDRTAEALEDVVVRYPGQHTLVSTHGGSIRCALYYLLQERHGLMHNCSLTRLRYDHDAEEWHVLTISAMPADVTW